MAALNEYETTVNGFATTLRLSDEDAARLGLKLPEPAVPPAPARKAAPAPANKSRTPSADK